jgi:hypothetical protein
MKKSVGAALFALAMILSIGLTLPSSAAAKKKKPKPKHLPDLVIRDLKLEQLPGNPPYVRENESGHTSGFTVSFRVMNIGRAKAGPSEAEVVIDTVGGRHIRTRGKPIRSLDPGEWSGKGIKVDLDYEKPPPLGLLKVVAIANATDSVEESDTTNNKKPAKHLLPVIADTWKAVDLETYESLPYPGFPGSLMTDTTQASALTFLFSTFDEASKHFEYVPTGELAAGWHFNYDGNGLHCTGDTSETRGPKDWPGSFWLNSALDRYDATVDVSDEPPPARGEIVCNGVPSLQVEWRLQSLETNIGTGLTPRMPATDCTRLSASHQEPIVGGGTTTWQWQLQAVVPDQAC